MSTVLYSNQIQSIESGWKIGLSIIIPTYNESSNIVKLLEAINRNVPDLLLVEIIVVDDNSPDGTGAIAESYAKERESFDNNSRIRSVIKVVHRKGKRGLISAVIDGIQCSRGDNIVIMDADLSHPPEMIPKMIEELFFDPSCDIVVASRYVNGGSIIGWPFKRRLLSRGATGIARHGLKIYSVKDPMSGFFAFRRKIIENIKFDTVGYKILLEILVKGNNMKVKELPYTFVNRKSGDSKLDATVMFDYMRSIWRLYRYGQKSRRNRIVEEKRKSVLFLSKAARFYTVGASGLLVNYLVSYMLGSGILSNFFYLHATTIGIFFSITSNFFLNKAWTFEDRDFSVKRTGKQYGLYAGFSAVGAAIQLSLLYVFVDSYGLPYAVSLLFAVAVASVGNFLFNKKWTFGEDIWG